MKRIPSVAVIGGAVSVAANLLPADLGQAWGPFAVLSTGVLLLATWVVASDHTAPSQSHSVPAKKAA